MEALGLIIQVFVGLSILNVWLLRAGRSTNWRGGSAQNMREEFAVYGLPGWSMPVVGSLKVLFALLLIGGTMIPGIAGPGALGLGILMLGAVIMHVKVSDPLIKSAPAFSLLALCAVIPYGSLGQMQELGTTAAAVSH